MIYRACALAVVLLMLFSVSAGVVEAKGKPDSSPGQNRKPDDVPRRESSPPSQDRGPDDAPSDPGGRPRTPPGHANRPEQTPSGTIPATPATPAEPNPGEGPATPAIPATPAQPARPDEDEEPEEPAPEEQGPLGFDVHPTYVWWYLTPYPTGGYNNLYPGAENVPGSWPITITAWETNWCPIDLYFAGSDFYSLEGYSFSITNLWIDDDSDISETIETLNDPYQMQNTFPEDPYFSGVEPGESVDLYFYLSFPEDQPITDYWAWLYIALEPSEAVPS